MTGAAVVLLTVTLTGIEVAAAPPSSVALAVIQYDPATTLLHTVE